MESGDAAKLTTALLTERDRSVMLARLTSAAALVPMPELLVYFVDVLLLAHQDRDRLKLRVAHLLAAPFRRTSEQSSAEQLALFAKAVEVLTPEPSPPAGSSPTDAAEVEPSCAPPTKAPTDIPALLAETERQIREQVERELLERKTELSRQRAVRAAARAAGASAEAGSWPKNLPIREVVLDVDPAELCCPDPDCGCERQVVRRETSWHIERELNVWVVLTHRLVRACGAHHGGPVIAPLPPKPVDKGHLSFDVAAHAIYLRYSHNLPIRRIVDMLADELVPVSEEMLDTLFTTTSERIEPVLKALIACVRAAKLVNLDDTPVLILDPERPNHRRTGRIWVAVGDQRTAWFFATPNWKSTEAETRLGALVGTLQGDGYTAFQRMAKKLGIKLAGCMAHLRRKLRKAMLAKDPRATEALALVQGLYRVEQLARLEHLDADAIRALRQARAVPLMEALERWARTVAPSIEAGSPLGQAWTYLDNQWDYLQTYLSDGRVSIDNNAAERALRRITIGRKLWLFFRGDATVERAARITSLLTTSRLHGANEREYLGWLLCELARREWSPEAAVRLLPDAWLAAKKKKLQNGAKVEV
jgi:transposase